MVHLLRKEEVEEKVEEKVEGMHREVNMTMRSPIRPREERRG
jgi:hypothetical protein